MCPSAGSGRAPSPCPGPARARPSQRHPWDALSQRSLCSILPSGSPQPEWGGRVQSPLASAAIPVMNILDSARTVCEHRLHWGQCGGQGLPASALFPSPAPDAQDRACSHACARSCVCTRVCACTAAPPRPGRACRRHSHELRASPALPPCPARPVPPAPAATPCQPRSVPPHGPPRPCHVRSAAGRVPGARGFVPGQRGCTNPPEPIQLQRPAANPS